jgi:hypothetical protein
MASLTVPVVVNHGVLCWVSGGELCCAMLVNHGESYWASDCEWWFAMLYQWLCHGELYCAIGCESWWVLMCQWLWIVVCYAVPVVVSHGEICCASGVSHGVLCWASGCESWCAIPSQWFWVMVCNFKSEFVNYAVLCWFGWYSHSLAQQSTLWFIATLLSIIHHHSHPLGLAFHTMIHNHWLSITHIDSQPLAHHNSPLFTTTGSS